MANSRRRSRHADDPTRVVVPRRITARSSRRAVVAVPDPIPPTPEESHKTIIARLQSRREARIRQRLAQRERRRVSVAIASNTLRTGLTNATSGTVSSVFRRQVAAETIVVESKAGDVSTVEIFHDGVFSGRGWETIRIRLLDTDGNTVMKPILNFDLAVRAEFGSAEFRPSILSPLDFHRGEATVHMLPRGRRTVVIKVLPFTVISRPMKFER